MNNYILSVALRIYEKYEVDVHEPFLLCMVITVADYFTILDATQ